MSLRHNSLRDTFAELMRTVKCKDVQTEPVLLPVDGLELPKGTVIGDQARLDISARSIWNASERAYFDVRVFHAQPSPMQANRSQQCISPMKMRKSGVTMQEFLKWRKEASHHYSSQHLEEWVVKLKDWLRSWPVRWSTTLARGTWML